MTGFKKYSEFVTETNQYERKLLIESIEAWHDKQQSGGGNRPTGPPGL